MLIKLLAYISIYAIIIRRVIGGGNTIQVTESTVYRLSPHVTLRASLKRFVYGEKSLRFA